MCPALVSVMQLDGKGGAWNLGEGGKVGEAVGEMATQGFMLDEEAGTTGRPIHEKNRNNGHYKNCKASPGNVMPTFATYTILHMVTLPPYTPKKI